MAYWLVKSEPGTYSFAQLQKDKRTQWDGVRNHTAAANLRGMKKGDKVLFYHSGEGKEIVGIAKVMKEAVPDPKDPTGKFVMVDLGAVKPVAKPVTLADIKADARFKDFGLVRLSRMSVVPVSDAHWKAILKMAGTSA